MKTIIQLPGPPALSRITEGFGSIDYQDAFQIRQLTGKNAKEIARALFQLPGWVRVLLSVRNVVVGFFGLKTDTTVSEPDTFFPVIENREEELVMGEDDKHLNFRASILKDTSSHTISLITIVHFHNRWGKLYFLPVKPFHRIIMRTLLKNYLKRG